MTDVWKSQPRKFCVFCKCWFADNRASRDFHERGKRHQESVSQKISELKKKGLKDAIKEKESSQYIIDMEKAAMTQFREDMRENPNLAPLYGIDLQDKKISFAPRAPSETSITSLSSDITAQSSNITDSTLLNSNITGFTSLSSNSTFQSSNITAVKVENSDVSSTDDDKINLAWQEVATEEGQLYYWNSITNESVWDLPESAMHSTHALTLPLNQKTNPDDRKRKSNDDDSKHSAAIKTEDTAMTKAQVKIKTEQSDFETTIKSEPNRDVSSAETKDGATTTGTIGFNTCDPVYDDNFLELPTDTLSRATMYAPDVYYDEERVQFGEKKVAVKTGAANVAFKKRKVNRSIRNNEADD